jgi:hypothetical protein
VSFAIRRSAGQIVALSASAAAPMARSATGAASRWASATSISAAAGALTAPRSVTAPPSGGAPARQRPPTYVRSACTCPPRTVSDTRTGPASQSFSHSSARERVTIHVPFPHTPARAA